MSLLGIAVAALTLGIAYIAKDVPTGEYMLSTFQAGQSFYSENAYDQAIEKYKAVGDVQNALLDDSEIIVTVGEVETTVKDAALYQVGNSYFKMFEEEFRLVESAESKQDRERRRQVGEEHLENAVSYFSRVEESTKSENLRVLAQSRIMTCWYSAKRYKEVIREGQKFIKNYPNSSYIVEALYNIGWAYYELKDYPKSIEAFVELTERFESGFQVSRALFQIGECYYDQQDFAAAIPLYQQLVDQASIGALSEQDLQKMQFEKVAGLVDETEYELTAKAQIRIGDSYHQLGDFDRAETSYRTVITVFSQERRLVEKAYQSLADMYFANQLLDQSVGAYREAIVHIPNRTFKARMQFQLAQRYAEAGRNWDQDLFPDAIREYKVYIKAYGEIAAQAGYSLANTWYEIGQAHYSRAERWLQEGNEAQAQEEYRKAAQAYATVVEKHPDRQFLTAARFNFALSKQMIGGKEERLEALEIYREIIAADAADTYARSSQFQMARIHFNQLEYDRARTLYTELIAATEDSTHLDIAHFELGLVLAKSGELEKATAAFLAVRQKAPRFALAHLEAGRALLGMGNYSRALEVLEKGISAVVDEKNRPNYYYLMGKVWVGKEDYQGAVEAFSRTIELTQDPVLKEIALYDRGTSYSKLADYAAAEKDLKLLVNSANERIKGQAQKMLGLAYLKLNKQQEAIESYRKLASTAEGSAERAEYMVLMLELYLELEQYDLAIDTGRQILAMDLEDKKENRDYWIKEQVYYLIGECHNSKGQYPEVISTYSEALKRYPNSYYSADMAYALGILYFQSDELDKATDILSDFVSRYPSSPNIAYAYYYLGYAHFNLREFDKSQSVFKALVDKYQRADVAPEALMRTSESAFNLGKFKEAISLYQQLLEVYGDSPFNHEAVYNMAWAFYELKNESEFIQSFERLLRDFPESEFAPEARFTLGDYHFNNEDYPKALVAYQHVLTDYPTAKIAAEVPPVLANVKETIAYGEYEKAMVIFAQGLALNKEGERDQALEKFAELIPIFTDLVEKFPGTEVEVGALSNLGMCYEFRRQWKEAVATFEKVITLYEEDKAGEDAFKFAKGHRDWILTSIM